VNEALQYEINRRAAAKNLRDFVPFVDEDYYMTTFHKYIADQVQEFLSVKTGKIRDILIIDTPPRHGKTELVTKRTVSWILGKQPKAEVIVTSYSTTIAEQFGREIREMYNNDTIKVFPNAAPDKNVQGAGHWQTAEGGYCHCASLISSLTGFGADYLFIDDPVKNIDQADSKAIMERIHQGLIPDVFSRVYPGGKIIIINTRWVENDVTGYVLENMSDLVWKHLSLPALCENEETDLLGRKLDESLMGAHLGDDEVKLPARMNNTTIMMQQLRAMIQKASGQRYWNALYQGHPSSASGNLVDVTTFKTITRKELFDKTHEHRGKFYSLAERMEYCTLSIDCTFVNKDGADYVAMGLWGYYKNDFYLIHLVNKRLSFTQTLSKIHYVLNKYKGLLTVDELNIENRANGPAIIDMLRQEKDLPPIVEVQASVATGGKSARAQAVVPIIESGRVFVYDEMDEDDVDQTSNIVYLKPHEMFRAQWKSFPFGAHDDIVDMTTQYLARAYKLQTGEDAKFERTIVKYSRWNAMMWSIYNRMTDPEKEQFIKDVGVPHEWINNEEDDYAG
jgi:predicted phage terminase large subunit-like protein